MKNLIYQFINIGATIASVLIARQLGANDTQSMATGTLIGTTLSNLESGFDNIKNKSED